MKYILAALAGAVLTFIVLKYVVKKKQPADESKTMENLLNLAKTPEALEIVKSDEFKNLMKTEAFKRFAVDFGTESLMNFIQV